MAMADYHKTKAIRRINWPAESSESSGCKANESLLQVSLQEIKLELTKMSLNNCSIVNF